MFADTPFSFVVLVVFESFELLDEADDEKLVDDPSETAGLADCVPGDAVVGVLSVFNDALAKFDEIGEGALNSPGGGGVRIKVPVVDCVAATLSGGGDVAVDFSAGGGEDWPGSAGGGEEEDNDGVSSFDDGGGGEAAGRFEFDGVGGLGGGESDGCGGEGGGVLELSVDAGDDEGGDVLVGGGEAFLLLVLEGGEANLSLAVNASTNDGAGAGGEFSGGGESFSGVGGEFSVGGESFSGAGGEFSGGGESFSGAGEGNSIETLGVSAEFDIIFFLKTISLPLLLYFFLGLCQLVSLIFNFLD
ncbi:hypothetical protein JCGZ_17748 [Jatropha curcas]|uniref:Uncharacterized protein n=1 Tax=Jatropha curcas TaxID=180498 RepID=A0A067K2W1_JATCU|nr:hypothetical protein JCGZ_17748 [Jatropha curcas]